MAIADTLQELATDISNAYDSIDNKGGTIPQNKNTNNLANAIDSIQTGITPSGTIQITENGPHDVTQYANADVDVHDNTTLNALLQGTPVIDIFNDEITTLTSQALYSKTNLRSVDFPNVTSVGTEAFRGCSNLIEVNCPNFAVNYYTALRCFQGCAKLKFVDFPKAESIPNSFLVQCSALETAIFGRVTRIDDTAFSNDTSLKTIINPTQSNLRATGAFSNTPFASGGTGGTVYTNYENLSFYSTLSTNANWASIYTNNSNNQTKSIQEHLIDLQQLGYNETTQEWDYKVDISPYYEIVTEKPSDPTDDKTYLINISGNEYSQHHWNGTAWNDSLQNITLEV